MIEGPLLLRIQSILARERLLVFCIFLFFAGLIMFVKQLAMRIIRRLYTWHDQFVLFVIGDGCRFV
jgi:hypothetical protein